MPRLKHMLYYAILLFWLVGQGQAIQPSTTPLNYLMPRLIHMLYYAILLLISIRTLHFWKWIVSLFCILLFYVCVWYCFACIVVICIFMCFYVVCVVDVLSFPHSNNSQRWKQTKSSCLMLVERPSQHTSHSKKNSSAAVVWTLQLRNCAKKHFYGKGFAVLLLRGSSEKVAKRLQ